ncbi:MAG: fasciclin domain-containing protein [Bacteroidetes bacterium]|nr:fasciclin domain-containing protein [Bacteroidota bacterium]
MKKNIASIFVMGISIASLTLLNSCGSKTEESTTTPSTEETTDLGGQSAVKDDDSQKDIVKVASESADHTTLVAAIKAAEYVDVLSNAGPFTVFAPTNDAFNKLPEGTVETLVKPENKDKLRDILEYHVAVAVYKTDMFKDGQIINMANLGNVKITIKNGEIFINENAKIIGTVLSSNGIIHVVDNVLLEKK